EAADEVGVRLEMVGGLPIWEAMPGPRHQREVFRIQSSVKRPEGSGADCGCIALSDVAIRFEDGSFKRPDIAIFCRQPDEEDEATSLIPEAVVEIVSKRYEAKDYEIGLPFYLKAGVKDVIIFDPSRNHVLHARCEGQKELASPVTFQLECGCTCTV
ncbi:MAG: Uma2 family endonuclease, partial [Fimbriimonadales bacterium]